jgi:hypothetical protein
VVSSKHASESWDVLNKGERVEFVKLIDRGGVDGRVLVATRNIEAGQEILLEDPLMTSSLKNCEDLDLPAIPRSVLQVPLLAELCGELALRCWINYWVFKNQKPYIQEQVLEFYIPSESQQNISTYLRAMAESCENVDIELFVRVNMIFATNSVGVHALGKGASALYSFACRITHSCQPNCIWWSTPEGKRIVQTITPVSKGEEFTIRYLEEDLDVKPVIIRRAALQLRKFFVCQCPRCCAFGDDTRRVTCFDGHCSGHLLIHQPSEADVPIFVPCRVCGKVGPNSYLQSVLEEECCLVKELDAINKIVNLGIGTPQTLARIHNLSTRHTNHYLAYEIAYLQWEAYHQVGNWRMVVRALNAQIECLENILNFPNIALADRYIRVGDALIQQCETQCTLLNAYDAYKQASRLHNLIETGFAASIESRATLSKKINVAELLIRNHAQCEKCQQFRNRQTKYSVVQTIMKYISPIIIVGGIIAGIWTLRKVLTCGISLKTNP